MEDTARRIPVTVLTGFLGAGKTTLLNRILTEHHGQRIAVIENEFGEIGIDQGLVIDADEEVFEMNNGCICCTVRGDLIRILGNLEKRRDKFDRVLVETTGLADPAPVAQTFFVDEDVKSAYALDGVVTVVDAKHLLAHLDESAECRQQIAFADVILMNKCDLVDEATLGLATARVRAMNGVARFVRSVRSDVPIDTVLDVGGFDLTRALSVHPGFLEPEYPYEWAATYEATTAPRTLHLGPGPDATIDVLLLQLGDGESALDRSACDRAVRLWSEPARRVAADEPLPVGVRVRLEAGDRRLSLSAVELASSRLGLYTEHGAEEFAIEVECAGHAEAPTESRAFEEGHTHDEDVTSVGLHLDGTLDPERFDAFIGPLLRERGQDIFRAKGILALEGDDHRYVFQAVHMLFEGEEGAPWGTAPRGSDLVFIGRNLDRSALEEGFSACRSR